MDHSKLNITTNETLRIHEDNINRNKRYLANLGFGERGLLRDDLHEELNSNPSVGQNTVIARCWDKTKCWVKQKV